MAVQRGERFCPGRRGSVSHIYQSDRSKPRDEVPFFTEGGRARALLGHTRLINSEGEVSDGHDTLESNAALRYGVRGLATCRRGRPTETVLAPTDLSRASDSNYGRVLEHGTGDTDRDWTVIKKRGGTPPRGCSLFHSARPNVSERTRRGGP